jgi:5'-3' exonuclease
MGIPSYFSYIVKNHSNIIRKYDKLSIKINNLYLDCNSIIYDAVRCIDFQNIKESDIDAIIRGVFVKIDEYIDLLKPDQNIFIAFDGVAPVAKLEQQRSRRYKSLYQANITKSIFKDTKPDAWNTTAITPGTLFMKKLNDRIRSTYNSPAKFNVINLIVSPSDKHGEGEHKLFEYIRDFPEQHIGRNTVIYGLDADLIMLSINHLPITKDAGIYLFRETPEFIKSINIELEPNESYMLDIPELARTITSDMVLQNGINVEDNVGVNRVYDYIFLCFFLGNDFMPHFPSVNIRTGGVDKMLNAYKATIGQSSEVLTDGKKIYWKNVRKLVEYLAGLEEDNFKAEARLRDRRDRQQSLTGETPEEIFKKFDSIPTYERTIEKYINPYKSNWQARYYKALFDIDIDDVRRKQICSNYLEGLEWTMKYYTIGCPDWRWCYNYNYPPLFCDLLEFIPYFDIEFIQNRRPAPVNELVQLSYVLPKQSLHLLPDNLYKVLLKEHGEWYKSDCEFIWAYCRYFWEAHVLLPHIDINELEKFVINL